MIRVQGSLRNLLLRLGDRILSAIVPSPSAPPRPPRPRVLLIRCDRLGDATITTGVLASLREALNPSRMDVACGTWAMPIFSGNPAVDEVIAVSLPWWLARHRVSLSTRLRAWLALPRAIRTIRNRHYDIAIDLRGDLREILSLMVLTGIPERVSSDRTGGASLLTSIAQYVDERPELLRVFDIAALVGAAPEGAPNIAAQPLSAERRAQLQLPERYVVVAPRGGVPNREWPSEAVAAFARLVHSRHGIPVVYTGAVADVSHAAQAAALAADAIVNLAGRTSLQELFAILQGAECVVATDSGPMHIAAALGAPLVALWGPGFRSFLPWSEQAVIVESPVRCECQGTTCRFTSGAGRCYRTISAESVMAAMEQVRV